MIFYPSLIYFNTIYNLIHIKSINYHKYHKLLIFITNYLKYLTFYTFFLNDFLIF
jgi:hypothetical protein